MWHCRSHAVELHYQFILDLAAAHSASLDRHRIVKSSRKIVSLPTLILPREISYQTPLIARM